MSINFKEFFEEYMDYWGEATAMVETMGDAGKLTAELRNYMTTAEDDDKDKIRKGLGDLYLSLNILIDYVGRDSVMKIVSETAEKLRDEIEEDKKREGLSAQFIPDGKNPIDPD
jgi:undecaprenyl pyrophosphate synthase